MGCLYGASYRVDVRFLKPSFPGRVVDCLPVRLVKRLVWALVGLLGFHVLCYVQDTLYVVLEMIVQYHRIHMFQSITT